MVDTVEAELVNDEPSNGRRPGRQDDKNDEEEYIIEPFYTNKLFLTVTVVIVIILSIVAYGYVGSHVKEILINEVQTNGDDDGINVKFWVIMSQWDRANGNADIFIYYDNQVTYSGTVPVSNDQGLAEVKYQEFIMGNGEYVFRVEMDGVSKERTFNLANDLQWFLIEDGTITVTEPTSDDKLEEGYSLKIFFQPTYGNAENERSSYPKLATVDYYIQRDGGEEQLISTVQIGNQVTIEPVEYAYTTSGNYTVWVTVENFFCRSDSPYINVKITEKVIGDININPVATIASPSTSAQTGDTRTYSSDSDPTDGQITKYWWTVQRMDENGDVITDDIIAEGFEKKFSYTFTDDDVGDIYISLVVWGDYPIDYESPDGSKIEYDMDSVQVRVTAKLF